MSLLLTIGETERLRAEVRGRVLEPGDRGYDDAREAWNRNIDQHPAVIVQPKSAADIAAAVRQASDWSMPVAVQSTGHGAVLPCDGAMLIDTSGLTDVSIDVDRQVARVAPGATWGAVMKRAERHGLAGRAGFNATIGVLGYSLGGGYGWLSRRHGLACDHIVGAELVLADGSAVTVDQNRRVDLLWALRGGAGGIGVVTALEFGLVPLPSVYGGALTFPLHRARELLRLFVKSTRDADTRLTVAIRLARIPSDGLLAKLFGGQPVVSVMICFLGEDAEGKILTREWREADPAHGSLGRIRTGDLGSIDGSPPKGIKSVQIGEQLLHLDEASIETLIARFESDDAPIFLTELRHVGGATRAGAGFAFDRREGEYLLHLESRAKDDEERDAALEWLEGTRSRMKAVLAGSSALGFVGDGERALVAAKRAYSESHWERLAAIKNQADPNDRFRFNIGAGHL